MTRKDFELIAAALQVARRAIIDKEPVESQGNLLDGVSYAADYLAVMLADTNPRFDSAWFLKATYGAQV